VPPAVIRAARRRLAELESAASHDAVQPDLFAPPRPVPAEGNDDAPGRPVPAVTGLNLAAALADVDPDALTPRAALDLLYQLKRAAEVAAGE